MKARPDLEALFPKLRTSAYRLTSMADEAYNCIAHAAGQDDIPWWPASAGTLDVYWPDGIAREETVAAFLAAFGTIGYVVCDQAVLEPGFEKIAIYVDAHGVPCHAARQQVQTGAWSSKLGQLDDIEHRTLEAVESDLYGKATYFMKRHTSAGRAVPSS
jgi:hypothetical protein